MKNGALIILFSFLFIASFAKPLPAFFPFENDGFCKLVVIQKNVYCITKSAIYKEEKNGLKQVIAIYSPCHSAVGSGVNIWLATDNGIGLFSSKSNTISAVLPEAITGNITHIEADEFSNIWFTKEWEGCFKIDNKNNIQQIVKVPVTYSLAHTSDSNIWVGTNVGLYKVPVSGKEITRYAEEGIADNDLPDNLVEQLHETGNSIWAVMPGHVSHIVPDEEESPDFENIGGKENELYDIAQIAGTKQTLLFATKQGILYLPDVQSNEQFRTGEIHQEVKETAFYVTDDITKRPAAVGNAPVISIQSLKDKIYFVTKKGFWSVSVSHLEKHLKNR